MTGLLAAPAGVIVLERREAAAAARRGSEYQPGRFILFIGLKSKGYLTFQLKKEILSKNCFLPPFASMAARASKI